jgi:NAD(P)-dependent dehydrogenase (short-subunit alcohol dehydrogenase family)
MTKVGRRGGGGPIVYIASSSGATAWPCFAFYLTAKGAVVPITRTPR